MLLPPFSIIALRPTFTPVYAGGPFDELFYALAYNFLTLILALLNHVQQAYLDWGHSDIDPFRDVILFYPKGAVVRLLC